MENLADMTNAVNKWLSFKRKAADTPAELPTAATIRDHIQRRLTFFLEDNQTWYELQKWAEENGMNEMAGIPTVNAALMDVAAYSVPEGEEYPPNICCQDMNAISAHKGKVEYAQLGTWVGEEMQPLALWAILIKTVDDVSYPSSVVHVRTVGATKGGWTAFTFPKGDDIMGLFKAALTIQMNRAKDEGLRLQERWVGAPYDFRWKYSMCPACGAHVRNMRSSEFDAHEEQWVGCDSCEWTARRAVAETVEDLLDRKAYMKEVHIVRKNEKANNDLRTGIEAVDEAVKKLPPLVEVVKKAGGYDYQAAKQLNDLANEMMAMAKDLKLLNKAKRH